MHIGLLHADQIAPQTSETSKSKASEGCLNSELLVRVLLGVCSEGVHVLNVN